MDTNTRLYEYIGKVSGYSMEPNAAGHYHIRSLDLYDPCSEEHAPVRLSAYGGLEKYIMDIECTDAEERYLKASYWYDRNLILRAIVIPSIRPEEAPAKIIASIGDGFTDEIAIFGPADYIETRNPEPMSDREFCRWLGHRMTGMEWVKTL